MREIHTAESFSPLTATRFVYSIVLMADVAHLYTHQSFPRNRSGGRIFPLGLACLIWLAALLLLLFRSPLGAFLNWACCAIILGVVAPNEGFQQAACDSIIVGIAFLLPILPKLQPSAQRWVMAAYLSAIYLDSSVHKLLSPMWRGGFGAISPMTLPSLVWIPMGWMSPIPAAAFRI